MRVSAVLYLKRFSLELDQPDVSIVDDQICILVVSLSSRFRFRKNGGDGVATEDLFVNLVAQL